MNIPTASLFRSPPKTVNDWLSLAGITFLILFTLRTCIYYSGLLGQISPETSTAQTLVILFQLIVHNLTLFVVLRPRNWGLYFLLTFMLIELTAALQTIGFGLLKGSPYSFDRLIIIALELLAVYLSRNRFISERP